MAGSGRAARAGAAVVVPPPFLAGASISETACGFSTGVTGATGAAGGGGVGFGAGVAGAADVVREDERAELPPAPVERLPGESLEVVRGLGMLKKSS